MEKKKWIIVILCIVICIMVVGYAAFSTQLKINGTASIESNWSIKFTKIEEVSKTKGATITNPPTVSGTTATFNVDLTTPGDKVVYNITIANEGTLNAIIEKIDMSDTGSDAIYFKVTGITKGDLLNKGETKIITVEIGFDTKVTTQPTKPLNNLSIEVKCVQNVGQTIVTPVTNYQIGDEVRLPGVTVTSTFSDGTSTSVNYSTWTVVKQTDDSLTLLSDASMSSSFNSFNAHFLYDTAKYTTAAQFGFNLESLPTYEYNGVSARIPTLGDLSEVLTVSGNQYTNTGNYKYTGVYSESMMWSYGYYQAGNVNPAMIVMDSVSKDYKLLVEESTNIMALTFINDPAGGEESINPFLYRPVIVLEKSDIPDQSNFE